MAAKVAQAELVLQAGEPVELMPAEVVNAVAELQPALDRLRSGAWRLLVVGCTNATDRNEAATFAPRLLNLADALHARR